MSRKIMRKPSDGASPQKNEAVVKPMNEAISRCLRPKLLASQPVMGRMMALATRYEVKVQVASSVVAERLPAICGSETLTTVVSSTSMKVLDMTAIAISQGLMSWEDSGWGGIRSLSVRTSGYVDEGSLLQDGSFIL